MLINVSASQTNPFFLCIGCYLINKLSLSQCIGFVVFGAMKTGIIVHLLKFSSSFQETSSGIM